MEHVSTFHQHYSYKLQHKRLHFLNQNTPKSLEKKTEAIPHYKIQMGKNTTAAKLSLAN